MALVPNAQLDSVLADRIAAVIRPTPEFSEKLSYVAVSASPLVDVLAEGLWFAANAVSPKDLPFTEAELKEALAYLVQARAAFVAGMKLSLHPKEIEYPAMLFVVLAAIGRYSDDEANVKIIPVPTALDSDGNLPYEVHGEEVRFNHKWRLSEPSSYQRVISALRSLGVPTGYGLPMDKDSETDDFYRYGVVDGVLQGPKGSPVPSPAVAFSRLMVEMGYLATLYGELRISYTALSVIKSGIFDLIARQVRGPARNTAPG